jgi:hypothetical protein
VKVLLLLAVLGCDDTWFGTPVPGTGSATGDEGGGTSGDVDHHPAGYADPSVHGVDARLGVETCVDCHGADLTGQGSALSCDTCHTAGWRTACTRCHGGTEDETGAPPRYIAGDTAGLEAAFLAHVPHVAGGIKAPLDCTACHVKPTDVSSEGHVFVADRSPGVAEVDFSGGIADGASWDGAGSCSNVYCHGAGQADDPGGSISHLASDRTCDDCHAGPDAGFVAWSDRMSGKHFLHLDRGMGCADCHGSTVDRYYSIIGPELHVDGAPQLDFGAHDITVIGESDGLPVCTGACHDSDHTPDRLWKR